MLEGGTGVMAAALASDEDTYLILEVDWNSSSVQKNLERHQYVIGDCHRLPLRDESFDVILLFEVLEHLRNPFEAVVQCACCLRPGGDAGRIRAAILARTRVVSRLLSLHRGRPSSISSICGLGSDGFLADGWPLCTDLACG